ncbi:glycosyltransferase [Corynebacterium timonense]|uniref:glycosyltransferase n=1 Tax=Corynebacterium timonense TaxID=441500 RepID=UPI001E62E358|nr:glycosyltransferase [Corynebacterium timonense]
MLSQDSTLRVLSIPAEHPYTRAVRPAGVAYLPDPDIDGHWWPHPALEARFWDTPVDADILHIHFGFEHRSPEQIAQLVRALPIPLVLTVHDLDNPHLTSAREHAEHRERLSILIDAAAAVITLTDCAAQQLREDYGAAAVRVIAHPRLVPASTRAAHGGGAGVFLKSLRANVVADPEFYRGIARRVPLTVYAHNVDGTRALRDALSGAPGITLVTHDRMDDATLHETIGRLDACLLPYTRGTHSGWLEMCRGLGTSVAAPAIGCYAAQADDPAAVETYPVADAEAAAAALEVLLRRGAVPYAGAPGGVAAAHAEVYREVLR